jgi:hypothetical protein
MKKKKKKKYDKRAAISVADHEVADSTSITVTEI